MLKAVPLVASLLFLGACSLPGRPESSIAINTLDTELDWNVMKLGPNDVIVVTVAGRPEYSSPESGWRIDSTGHLNVPLIGAVKLADYNLQEAQEIVQAEFRKYIREPSTSLSVLEWKSQEFYAFGQVAQPGTYTMTRPLTLFEAFTQARGFARGADREHVYLLRPHGKELEVYEFNGATPDSGGLVAIRPRDIIFVRQTGWSTFQEQLLPIINAFGVNTINFTNSSVHESLLE